MTKRKCTSCGFESTDASLFRKDRKQNGKTYVRNMCLTCHKNDQAKRSQDNYENKMLIAARARAAGDSLPFDIDVSDIVIPSVCPLLGIPLDKQGNRMYDVPSLDKKIPSLGYTKGNVWVISSRANTLKRDATLSELEKIVKHWRAHEKDNRRHRD